MSSQCGPQDHPLVEARPSPIQGTGLFARVGVAAGADVIEYTGERIDKAESLRRCEQGNHCIFAIDDRFDIDGSVPWNLARFINHSCNPNCRAERGEGRVWIVAARPIAAGEEITFNYGYDLEEFRDHPCHCGAPNCVGYMVDEGYHPQIRRILSLD